MRKHIAGILILVMLLLAGCRPVGPVVADPSQPSLNNTIPTVPEITKSEQIEPTAPDAIVSIDWSMNVTWVTANADWISNHNAIIKGTVINQDNAIYLDLDIEAGQNFLYQFTISEPNGYLAGSRLVEVDGDFNTAGYVLDIATGEKVWSVWAISTENKYFVFVLPDDPTMFLVGAADPNVTAKQILDYFDAFVDHFLPEPVVPEHDPMDWLPKDVNTDAETVAIFQQLFAEDTWYANALKKTYDDPRNASVEALFGITGFVDEQPITDAERAEFLNKTGYADFEWLPGMRFPIDKMNQVLQTVFGLAVEDMNTLNRLDYLASTNCYYRFGSDSPYFGRIRVVGTKTLDNGKIEVYYYSDYGQSSVEDMARGVVTLKPVEDGYHILSNRWFE